MKRAYLIGGSVLAALLLAVIVVGIVLINAVNNGNDEAQYRACMQASGALDNREGESVEAKAERMATAAEACSS